VVAVQRQIPVPDVLFKPLAIAVQQITEAGLKAVQKDPELAPASVAPGNVKSQNPAHPAKVPPGATIELVVAAQPTTVPNLVGKKISEAQILLQQNGLDLGTVSGTVTTANADTVLITSQDPNAFVQVARGSTVTARVPSLCRLRGCIKFETIDLKTMRTLNPGIKPALRRVQ
jgi:beta-lactam-binding protein with PASTA domain